MPSEVNLVSRMAIPPLNPHSSISALFILHIKLIVACPNPPEAYYSTTLLMDSRDRVFCGFKICGG